MRNAIVLAMFGFATACSSSDDDAGGGGGAASGPATSSATGATSSKTSSGTATASASGNVTGSGTGTGGAARQHLLVESTIEGADWADGWDIDSQRNDNGYSLAQSSEQVRFGASAIRYELRSTDPLVSSSVRTEMTRPGDDDEESMERWYGLSYFLADWGSDTGGESILQWHDTDGSCPPLSIQIYGNEMQLTSCIEGGNTYFPLGDVVSDEWMDVVIHVVWRTDATGALELWRNGEQLVSETGIRTQSPGGSYIKVGMNKWSWAPDGGTSNQTNRTFFVDEIRVGDEQATLYDVAPGDY